MKTQGKTRASTILCLALVAVVCLAGGSEIRAREAPLAGGIPAAEAPRPARLLHFHPWWRLLRRFSLSSSCGRYGFTVFWFAIFSTQVLLT